MSGPDATVAVASLHRPVRLRWLLNALEEQTVSPERLEVIVAIDRSCAETKRLLGEHPLAVTGRLREVHFPAHSTYPGAGRNAAWRAGAAPLVLFTDDDCRPRSDWVANALAAAEHQPGSIMQGRTQPDPDELEVLRGAPWARTMCITPPTAWAETCNIAYPRALLERLGGFDEQMRVGEDADLGFRARALGAEFGVAREMVVFHAVEAGFLIGMVLARAQWRDIAWLVKRYPAVRADMWGGIWWKREHAAFVAALAGTALAAGPEPVALLLASPWLALAMGHRGYGARGLIRSLSELPGRAAIDAAEILTMIRGSVRYRTLLL